MCTSWCWGDSSWGLFSCSDSATFKTPLPTVKSWSSSVCASAYNVLVVVPWCGNHDVGVFILGGLLWRCDSVAFVMPLPSVKWWSSYKGESYPSSMHEDCWCDDFVCRLCLCPVLVWTVWWWIICIGGFLWRRDSDVVTTPLLTVNFWRRLSITRVVGQLSGDLYVALILLEPSLQTWPCEPHSRLTSLDPKTTLGVDLTCSYVCWYHLVVAHFCYLRTNIIISWGNLWKLSAPFSLPIFYCI